MNKYLILLFKVRVIVFANLVRFLSLILKAPLPQKISVGGFIKKDGKFLVLDLSYRKGFGFPGGMIDPGENVEQALIREIFEETGLSCTNIEYIGSKEDIQYGYPTLALAFKVETQGEIRESIEGKLLWKTAAEIQENCAYSNWIYLLKMYKDKYASH